MDAKIGLTTIQIRGLVEDIGDLSCIKEATPNIRAMSRLGRHSNVVLYICFAIMFQLLPTQERCIDYAL